MIPDRQTVILTQIEEIISSLINPDENIRNNAIDEIDHLPNDYLDLIASIARNNNSDISEILSEIRHKRQSGGQQDRLQEKQKKPRRKPIGGYYSKITGEHFAKNDFQRILMDTIISVGGQGRRTDIENEIGRRFKEEFSPVDLELISGTPRWKKYVDWLRMDFVERGIFKHDSPWGIWELETWYLSKHSEIIQRLRNIIEEGPHEISILAFKTWLGHRDTLEDLPSLLEKSGVRLHLIYHAIEWLNDQNSDDTMLPFLSSEIDDLRLAAIKKVKNLEKNPATIKKLEYLFRQDPKDEIRTQAFWAWLEHKTVLTDLPVLLKTPGNGLDYAKHAEEWLNEKKFKANEILPFLCFENDKLRLIAVNKLKKLAINSELKEKLEYLFEQDSNEEIRIHAFNVWLEKNDIIADLSALPKITKNYPDLKVIAMEWLNNKKFSEEEIRLLIDSGDKELRVIGISKLRTPSSPETIKKLKYLFESDSDEEIRTYAFKLWLETCDEEAGISSILNITGKNPLLTIYAAEWLNDKQINEHSIFRLLGSDNDALRIVAIKKLRSPVKNPLLIRKLISILEQDKNDEIKTQASRFLLKSFEKPGLFQDEQIVEPIMKIYSLTDDFEVKSWSIKVLYEINKKNPVIPKISQSNLPHETAKQLRKDLNDYIIPRLKWR
jgi:hypothetical protein